MANQVTYVIDLVPENAEKIDRINKLLIEGYSEESKPSKPAKSEKPAKSSGPSAEDLKSAAKKAKKDHGEDFAMDVLKEAGVDVGASLGRSIGKIDEADYADIIKAWEAGPSDDLDDDDDGLDDDNTPEVDVEAVKAALKAYAKSVGRDEAKAIMNKNGAKALSDVDNCSEKQLAAIMKAVV